MPHRAGERHPKARLTDALVVEMRDLYEVRRYTCREIVTLLRARGVQVQYRNVRKIVSYQRRVAPCQSPS